MRETIVWHHLKKVTWRSSRTKCKNHKQKKPIPQTKDDDSLFLVKTKIMYTFFYANVHQVSFQVYNTSWEAYFFITQVKGFRCCFGAWFQCNPQTGLGKFDYHILGLWWRFSLWTQLLFLIKIMFIIITSFVCCLVTITKQGLATSITPYCHHQIA